MSAAEILHFEDREHVDLPTIDHINEYIDFMRETVRSVGRSVKMLARFKEHPDGRITAQYAGKEFFLPGSLTEWSIPGKLGQTEQLRDRSFVMSLRALGETGATLCLIETDAVRSKRVESADVYERRRGTYRLSWDTRIGVYQAKKNIIETTLSTVADAEVLPRMEFDAPDKLIFDTEASGALKVLDYGWEPVSEADLDGLLRRTHEYQRELVAQLTQT